MNGDGLKYTAVCIGIYLLLAMAVFFPLAPLVDFISFDFRAHLIFYVVFLLIIDPVATWFLADRFRFREKKEDGDELL